MLVKCQACNLGNRDWLSRAFQGYVGTSGRFVMHEELTGYNHMTGWLMLDITMLKDAVNCMPGPLGRVLKALR